MLDKPNDRIYIRANRETKPIKQEVTKMKKADVKAYMINGDGNGTKKILYITPVKIDATWTWYDRYNGYGKAATSKEAAKSIVETEIVPNCKEV